MTGNRGLVFRAQIVVAVIALGGCGSGQEEAAEPVARRQADPVGIGRPCPIEVEETTVEAEETEGGAGLVFRTTGDVDEVRRRVARMAEMQEHRRDHGHSAGADESVGRHQHRVRGVEPLGSTMPPAEWSSEDIEDGARLRVTPRDPADRDEVLERVAQMATHMQTRRCPRE